MSLLFFDGFDSGDFAQGQYGMSGTNAPTVTSSTRFGIGSALVFTGSGVQTATRNITASSQVFVGVALTRAGTSYVSDLIALRGDANTTQHLSLRWPNTTTLALYRGTTQIATASVAEPASG